MANASSKLAILSYLGYKRNLVVVRINQVTSLDTGMSLYGPGWGKVKGLWEKKNCFLVFFLLKHANVPKACSLHNSVCTR